ncbi:MAG: hypothetical protein M1834_005334 [Cirrosporium novae-zelandiae]|nr:MAG: hypothetical protein M1834_005334 [Cirrosporium novae-zelandiae]
MAFFSRFRGSKKTTNSQNDSKNIQTPAPPPYNHVPTPAPPPYKHVPTPATVGALYGTPISRKIEDRKAISAEYRRRTMNRTNSRLSNVTTVNRNNSADISEWTTITENQRQNRRRTVVGFQSETSLEKLPVIEGVMARRSGSSVSSNYSSGSFGIYIHIHLLGPSAHYFPEYLDIEKTRYVRPIIQHVPDDHFRKSTNKDTNGRRVSNAPLLDIALVRKQMEQAANQAHPTIKRRRTWGFWVKDK